MLAMRTARKAANLTLAQLEAVTGIPAHNLLRMERGTLWASPWQMESIAAALKYDGDWHDLKKVIN